MRVLVVYDSVYGNTETIARAVADSLMEHHFVRILRAGFAQASDLSSTDLLVLGGPTQRHHAGDGLQEFLDRGAARWPGCRPLRSTLGTGCPCS